MWNRKELIVSLAIALCIVLCFAWPELWHSEPTTEESQFTVGSTLLYTSRVQWSDGRIEVSYATSIIAEDGSSMRLVGRYDFQPGAEYRLLTVPDAYGETWDQVLSIEQLTFPEESDTVE